MRASDRPVVPGETRAEIARRRLAQLAASFDADLPPEPAPSSPVDPPAPARHRLESRHVRVLATLGVAASVLLVWWLLSGRPETSEPSEPLPVADATAVPDGEPAPAAAGAPTEDLVVDVVGKVHQPGIVTIPAGSRVHEAIEAAGGLDGDVDTTALNMARVLVDGEQILVGIDPVVLPGAAAAGGGGAPAGAAGPAGAPVNLNAATIDDLDTLPGVGPVTAQAILDWRLENGQFASVEELLDVRGIGEATLAELRDLVTV